MKIQVTVCNFCRDPLRPTRQYDVRRDGRQGVVDACEEHGEPLELALEEPPAPPPSRPRQPRRGIVVTPVDDIVRTGS